MTAKVQTGSTAWAIQKPSSTSIRDVESTISKLRKTLRSESKRCLDDIRDQRFGGQTTTAGALSRLNLWKACNRPGTPKKSNKLGGRNMDTAFDLLNSVNAFRRMARQSTIDCICNSTPHSSRHSILRLHELTPKLPSRRPERRSFGQLSGYSSRSRSRRSSKNRFTADEESPRDVPIPKGINATPLQPTDETGSMSTTSSYADSVEMKNCTRNNSRSSMASLSGSQTTTSRRSVSMQRYTSCLMPRVVAYHDASRYQHEAPIAGPKRNVNNPSVGPLQSEAEKSIYKKLNRPSRSYSRTFKCPMRDHERNESTHVLESKLRSWPVLDSEIDIEAGAHNCIN